VDGEWLADGGGVTPGWAGEGWPPGEDCGVGLWWFESCEGRAEAVVTTSSHRLRAAIWWRLFAVLLERGGPLLSIAVAKRDEIKIVGYHLKK
jgi:hypothetical protein